MEGVKARRLLCKNKKVENCDEKYILSLKFINEQDFF